MRPVIAYDCVRISLAGVLLLAAGLKGHQLATEPVLGTGLLDSRWFLIGVVEFELFFGLWLLAGLLPRWTWLASLGCFALFACISLTKALSGEASCGCFGRVPVNPWYTLTLDALVVAALLRWRPAAGRQRSPAANTMLHSRTVAVAVLWAALGVPAAATMGSYQSGTLTDSGTVLGDSQFVILEPETWVGKRFPLLDHIDIGDRLADGEWIVLLYHRDCSSCQEGIPKYERRAWQSVGIHDTPRFALVQLAPYGASLAFADSRCSLGRLSDVKEWFVETPVEVVLDHGVVARVKGRKTPPAPGTQQMNESTLEDEFEGRALLSWRHASN